MTRNTVMIKSFFINFVLIVVKLIGGILFVSASLIADALHSASDFFTDIMVIFGIRQSNKPPDKEHPFGHGKAEYVVSLLLGLLILFVAYQIFTSMITRALEGPTTPSIYAVFIPVFVVGIKYGLAKYILYYGDKLDSHALKASAKESFADIMSSIVVLFGIIIGFIGEQFNVEALLYADLGAALVVGVLILRVSYHIIQEAIVSILGKSAPQKVIKEVSTVIKTIDGVKGVDNLRMIVYGHYYQALVEICVEKTLTVKQGHDIASKVKRKMKENSKISHVLVHVNPEG